MLYEFLIAYVLLISLLAVGFTIYDKLAAVFNKWRISERALLTVSAMGGSVAMLITMLIIRHKTRKPKFMVGIPVILALQVLALIVIMVAL